MVSSSSDTKRLILAAILCCLVLIGTAYYSPANALEFNGAYGTVSCDIADESLAVKVVYCVKMAVFVTTEAFLVQTTNLMLPVVYTVMLFALILLGVKIAAGERDPQKLVMSYLLRFGVALLIADNMGRDFFPDGSGLMPQIFTMMEEFQAIVIPALYVNSDTCDISTTAAASLPAGGYIIPVTYTPWQYLDCIFDYIFGFGVDSTIASSIFGFIGSTFFSGSIGAMIFMFGLAIVLSLALFAFRTIYAVLVSYVYVGFLMTLAPFFAAFLMIGITENSFYTWLKNIVGGIILPFVMVAYLAFALPLLDTFVFDADDEYSLVNTLGRQDEITEKYRVAEPLGEIKNPSDFEFFEDVPGYDERIIQDPTDPQKTGAMDWFGMLHFSKVDLGEEHIQELWKIGFSLLQILGVTWLIIQVSSHIIDLSAKLANGGYKLAASISNTPLLFENNLKQATSAMNSSTGILGGNKGLASLVGSRN